MNWPLYLYDYFAFSVSFLMEFYFKNEMNLYRYIYRSIAGAVFTKGLPSNKHFLNINDPFTPPLLPPANKN